MSTVESTLCHGHTKFLQLQGHFQALCVPSVEEFQRTFFKFGKHIATDCNHASRRFVCQLWGFHRGEYGCNFQFVSLTPHEARHLDWGGGSISY